VPPVAAVRSVRCALPQVGASTDSRRLIAPTTEASSHRPAKLPRTY